jgi:hypothetical protein
MPFSLINKDTTTNEELVATAPARLIANPTHWKKPPQETGLPVEHIRNQPHQCETVILSS